MHYTKALRTVNYQKMAGVGFFVDEFNLTADELAVSEHNVVAVFFYICIAENLKVHWYDK